MPTGVDWAERVPRKGSLRGVPARARRAALPAQEDFLSWTFSDRLERPAAACQKAPAHPAPDGTKHHHRRARASRISGVLPMLRRTPVPAAWGFPPMAEARAAAAVTA
jgi:hypothetical protein